MDRKTKSFTKVLTGILSGLAFLFMYAFLAYAGTDESGGLPQEPILPSPEKIGQGITSEIANIFMIAGIGFAIITVLVIGLRIAISKNSEEAAQTYEWLKYVIIGSIILAVLSSVIGIVIGLEEKFYRAFELPKTSTQPSTQNGTELEGTYEDKWYKSLFAGIAEWIYNAFQSIGKLVGFKPIDQLLFNDSAFTVEQFKFMLSFYWLVTLVAVAFIVVMIGKSAVKLIASGYSVRKRVDVMEEVYTWFQVIILIAIFPQLFVYLMKFFDTLTLWLFRYVQLEYVYLGDSNFANSDMDTLVGQIKTPDALLTAVVKAMYGYLYFKLNMIFLVRRIILGVFFLFAPAAAALWGIKKDSNVMNVWIGELITNASMGFFYGFALLAVLHLVNSLELQGWFLTLIAMWMLPQIGGTLRNMLQDWFARASGIDEERLTANPFTTGVAGMLSRTKTSLSRAFANRMSTFGQFLPSGKHDHGSSGTSKGTSDIRNTVPGGIGGTVGSSAGTGTTTITGTHATSTSTATTSESTGFVDFKNRYSDTNFTRSAFLQNFALLAGSSRIAATTDKIGNLLHTIANITRGDNPLFAITIGAAGHVIQGAGRFFGGATKIGSAVSHTTLQRMVRDDKYKEQINRLAPVANFLSQYGKADLLTKAIITGNTEELAEFLINAPAPNRELSRPLLEPDDVIRLNSTIIELHEAFKKERETTYQQLGLNKLSAAVAGAKLAMGGPEKFEQYFYRKHPYKNASDAFIFKI